jgi:hypothetical protein
MKLLNKHGTPFNAFHSNGGWNLREDVVCSNSCWTVYKNKQEADDAKLRMLEEAEEQRDRWGDEYTDNVLGYISKFKVAE